jgi:hypothetical protein
MAELAARVATEDVREITFTTTERRPLDDIEDAPPGATLSFDDPDPDNPDAPRKAYAIVEGVQRTLTATSGGLFHPETSADERALDSFGLVKHETGASPKAEAKKAEAASEPAGNGS